MITSSPAVVVGAVYIGSTDGNLYALNAGNGVKLWNFTTNGGQSSPAIVGGVAYVGSEDQNLYAFNVTNGAKLWNYYIGSFVESAPAVTGGVVYVESGYGGVYALGALPSPSNNQDVLYEIAIALVIAVIIAGVLVLRKTRKAK